MKHLVLMVVCLSVFMIVQQSTAQNLDSAKTSSQDTLILKNTVKKYRSDQVTVTGSRIPDDSRTPRYTVVSVQRTDIEQSPARSVEELLRNVAGVDVRQRGALGVQADVSIRGGTFEQTLVLIDGVKMLDPQTGHHAMNIPLTLDDIERIEIVKGPVSHQFGPNAMNGAINIITRKHSRPFARLQGMVGDFGLWEASFSGALPLKLSETTTLKNRFSFMRRRSDGYRNRPSWTGEVLRLDSNDRVNNTDFDITTFSGSLELFSSEKASLELAGSWSGKQFGANSFYSLRFPTQYEETTTSLVSLIGNFEIATPTINLPLRVIASWRRNQDYFLLRRENPAFYRNLHTSNTISVEAQTTIALQRSTIVVGAEAAADYLESNNLGFRNRTRISAFGEIRTKVLDNLTAGGSGTVLYNSDWGLNTATGLNLGWQINDQFSIYATVGRSFRVPTYTDLYYRDAATVGDSTLKPERSETFEVAGTWREGIVDVRGTLFYRFASNLIDYVRTSPTGLWKATNLSSATTNGADIHIALATKEAIPILERVTGSYTALNPTFATEPGTQSRYALDQLLHQAALVLDFRFIPEITAQTRFRYEKRINVSTDAFLTDVRLGWNGYGVEVFAEATNVFNTLAFDFVGIPAPGRWLRFGAAVNAAELLKQR
jgi:iron complex outermembrane receptor protein